MPLNLGPGRTLVEDQAILAKGRGVHSAFVVHTDFVAAREDDARVYEVLHCERAPTNTLGRRAAAAAAPPALLPGPVGCDPAVGLRCHHSVPVRCLRMMQARAQERGPRMLQTQAQGPAHAVWSQACALNASSARAGLKILVWRSIPSICLHAWKTQCLSLQPASLCCHVGIL